MFRSCSIIYGSGGFTSKGPVTMMGPFEPGFASSGVTSPVSISGVSKSVSDKGVSKSVSVSGASFVSSASVFSSAGGDSGS